MDYFSKFLRQGTQLVPQKPVDHALEFHRSWQLVRVRSIHSKRCSAVPTQPPRSTPSSTPMSASCVGDGRSAGGVLYCHQVTAPARLPSSFEA